MVCAILMPICVTLAGQFIRLTLPRAGFSFVYIPATALVAYVYGRRAGVITGTLSLLLAWRLFIGPGYSFALDATALITLGLYGASLFSVVIGMGHIAGQQESNEVAARTQSRLAVIVESSNDAILSKTLDGVILTWNAVAAGLFGYTPADVIGRSVTMLAPPDRVGEIQGILARLRQGQHIDHYESVRVRKDGTRLDVSLTISPIRDSAGHVVAASTITRDISDRKRIERQQRLIIEATEALTETLDLRARVESFVARLVPAMGDSCGIALADEDERHDIVAAYRDPEHTELVRRVSVGQPCPDASVPAQVIRTDRAELYPDVADTLLEAIVPDEDHRAALRRLRVRSALIVPLTARGRTLGAMTWIACEPRSRYDAADLVFAEELASHAALAVDNARLHEVAQQQRAAAERVADRLGRLQTVSAALSEALTLHQVADVATGHAVHALGARAAALSLFTPDGATLELIRSVGYPAELIARWRHFEPREIEVIADAIDDGKVVWHESQNVFRTRYPRRGEPLPPGLAGGARAAVPLMSRGQAIGVLYMNFADPRGFAPDDLDLMLTLGRLCAQACERARLYEQEHRVAETLQHAFLPAALPQIPGVTLDAAYRPGVRDTALGGDWYDVFQLPDGRVALSIGDVVGHGLRAAIVMGQVRQSIRAAALEDSRPSRVLRRANEVLRLTYSLEGMATALFGIFTPATSTFTYAAAGHPAPALIGVDREPEILMSGGVPLGYIGVEDPPSHTLTLPAGTLLAFYTDGLTETARDPVAGEAALIDALRREIATPSTNHAAAIVERVLGARDATDDIAVITLSVHEVPLEEFELTLPAEPASAPLMRQALRKLIAAIGSDEQEAAAITVATGEAVNNAIEHAYGAASGVVRIRARHDGTHLHVDVEDEGTWRPGRAPDGGGHGLSLMRALVDSVDVITSPTGTRVSLTTAIRASRPLPVWARVEVDDAPSRATAPNGAAPPAGTKAGGPRPGGPGDDRRPRPTEPAGGDPAAEDVPHRPATFEIAELNHIPVVAVSGDLDMTGSDLFRDTLERAARTESTAVVVSLAGASYLDSHSIRTLFQFGRRLATNRRCLVLAVPPALPFDRVLRVAGLDRAFRVEESLEQAVACMAIPSVPPDLPRNGA